MPFFKNECSTPRTVIPVEAGNHAVVEFYFCVHEYFWRLQFIFYLVTLLVLVQQNKQED
ncbi:MAG: hypothetical protein ACOYK6_00530 [Chthoniobacterales bacterium]